MPTRLKHPEHGYHLCYTPEDVEVHKAIGWVPEETENTLNRPQSDAYLGRYVGPPSIWEPTLIPERKKPGRKPKVKHVY